MATFSGRLALAQDRGSELSVEISLGEERIRITANDDVIGDWSFEEVEIFNFDDGLHLFAEGEEVVLSSEQEGFVPAMLEPAVAGPHEGPVAGQRESADESSEGFGTKPPASAARWEERRRRRGAHEA